ncbi:menaquinone biosynthesis decarboxylase [Helicobacter cholecystus]|uniref:Menaquinone biosynthesis decarboxylase n=1 Tax=Helicobacter cholecystus TaxID=45498 RepID=A0A3D8IX53_9HELI|nr:menaquinone biosynthesis decarboxylase [Helicobacter cholecystus]RDU69838.1 menaquinone biosynthesis decarboxylase [Helicobacter cholecystus]VEJ25821.1 3-octaprenyl-4-hydroxybenzoate decarboxylase [Helicobacter cholecystus]
MQNFINLAQKHNLLKVIDTPLDIDLEIAHLSYIEVKKQNPQALLFTHPKRGNKSFTTPVLTNIFGSFKLLDLIVGKEIEEIAHRIENLLKLSPPKTLGDKIIKAKELFSLRHAFPKILRTKGECQEIINLNPSLLELPALKTWERDGGAFITMGQVYTQSLKGEVKNLGMYRLQIFDDTHLALHWQIHKDSNHFFHEYQKAGVKMPVSIALGGDPLYTWCGQAPMPYGAFELMLYGMIRSKKVKLVKSITNPIMIPSDVDFVIEGWVDPSKMELEGPFGDHTGYYTPIEPYPVLEVSAITHKRSAIFPATVVGKPPLEDKYMGYLTERLFLPILKTTAHGLLDYHMPENGVFHNLILAQISPNYPAHSQQIMHAFWGVGQMSFVKHAIFVNASSPKLTDYQALTTHILNRFHPSKILITEGICDALDHSSPKYAQGGKLGLDVSGDEVRNEDFVLLSDEELFKKIKALMPEAELLRQYFTHTHHPITLLGVQKDSHSLLPSFHALAPLQKHLSILIALDAHKNDLDNPYMIVWRVANNIDAKRDIVILENLVCIDATDKGECDGYTREWPLETDCNSEVISSLRERGLLDVNDEFLHHFHITGSSQTKAH